MATFQPGISPVPHQNLAPAAPTEPQMWVEQSPGNREVTLANGEHTRLSPDFSYASFEGSHAKQDLVGFMTVGRQVLPIVGVSYGTGEHGNVRDFVVVHPEEDGAVRPIGKIPHAQNGRLAIGRNTGLDDKLVSREHVGVSIEYGQIRFDDTSTNGTYLLAPSAPNTPLAYSGNWQLSPRDARGYRPIIVEALPDDATPQVIGRPEGHLIHRDDHKPSEHGESLRGRPPLATRDMMLARYGMDGEQIAKVELAPGNEQQKPADALYIIDRRVRLYGDKPRQFMPGGDLLGDRQRFVTVTQRYLEQAEEAMTYYRQTGDASRFIALRPEPFVAKGIRVSPDISDSLSVGRTFWRTSFGEDPDTQLSRDHAFISVSGDPGAVTVHVQDKGTTNGTRLVVANANSAYQAPLRDETLHYTQPARGALGFTAARQTIHL